MAQLKIKTIVLAFAFALWSMGAGAVVSHSQGHSLSSHSHLKKKSVIHHVRHHNQQIHHSRYSHPNSHLNSYPNKTVAHKKKNTAAAAMSESLPVETVTAASLGSPGLISSLGSRMVSFVRNTIATLRYTAYKFGGTHFDTSNGIYILDCSDYVDHLLKAANPSAYSSLVNSTGSDKPTSEHYYHFFTGLTYQPRHYWNKIDNVKELQPGDVLVFRNTKDSRTGVLGHVMVVMKKPVRSENSFIVRVTDSASVGHSQDTRLPHTSGIGIGTMQLKINPETGHPSAYAWKLGASWEKHVNFAMARPLGH